MGQEARRNNGFGDDLRGNRGNLYSRAVILYAFALGTGILGPDVADDLNLCRDDIQLLRGFLTYSLEPAATVADFVFLIDIMNDFSPGRSSGSGFLPHFFRVCSGT